MYEKKTHEFFTLKELEISIFFPWAPTLRKRN